MSLMLGCCHDGQTWCALLRPEVEAAECAKLTFKKSSPADKIGFNWRKLDKSGENWRKLILTIGGECKGQVF